jgi:hypothetical protein
LVESVFVLTRIRGKPDRDRDRDHDRDRNRNRNRTATATATGPDHGLKKHGSVFNLVESCFF